MVKENFTLRSTSQRTAVDHTDATITITFDPSGVFIASKGGIEEEEDNDEMTDKQENEPAWNFRLWGSSIHLARHLESIFQDPSSVPDCVLELGAGTGLPSIVAHKLGCPHVISTDLPRAMPLLYHNLVENITSNNAPRVKGEAPDDDVQLCCPSGHLLQDEQVSSSDEFMCSVCDEDIEMNALVRRCQCCNFDLCHDHCLAAISSGNVDDLPLWFQIDFKFRREFGHSDDINSFQHVFPGIPSTRSVSLLSCDWTSDTDRARLQSAIQSKLSCSSSGKILIIGADISYSSLSVDALMMLLPKLASDLRNCGSSMHSYQVRILLMHQVRSRATTKRLLNALKATDWRIGRRLIEVSTDSRAGDSAVDSHEEKEDEQEEEEDGSATLDVASGEIVDNGIYLIDIILD